MKRLLMRYISIILTVLILITCIPLNTFASFSDVPANASYSDALSRLTSLGIVSGQGKFNPDSPLTREQFAAMIVIAAGFENMAASMKGSTDFADIATNAWSSGYINAAVAKSYMGAMADGKFHPTQAVTYMQLCAMLVRALGYTTTDLSGTFPYNYVTKAYDLGLTDGISLGNNANVPRWIGVTMIDRLLDTNMKQTTAGTTAKTFMEASGYYTKCIVYGDSNTIDSLSKGQVLTDKGTYNNPSNIKLELGSENYLVVKNSNIIKASGQSTVLKVSVDLVTENRVSYKDGDSSQSIVLPDNITYYYQGQKLDFAKLQTILQKSSSIVFNYTTDNSGYSFAVVFDPVYSKPEIAENFVPSSNRLGSISFGSSPIIIRDGDIIDISQIVDKDVVYQVSDIWGGNNYIQVIDKKVGGKITDILPNKLSPKTLLIDGVSYDLSKEMDIGSLTGLNEFFTIGSNIVVYLGYDGKIVNVERFGTENNSNYALVLDTGITTTTDKNGIRNTAYTAKLLFSDGVTAQYNTPKNSVGLKGQLVNYSFIDKETLSLTQIAYNFPSYTNINRGDRLLGDSYVADNVKIFNIIQSDSGTIVNANIINWSDLPNGTISNGKIYYTNTAGSFNDINLILTNDILNQRYKIGIVKDISNTPSSSGYSYSYTVLVEGKEYKYSSYITDAIIGSTYKFEMSGSSIKAVTQNAFSSATGSSIQAIDSRRIKINNTIYFFKNNISVYYKDSTGKISIKTLADVNMAQSYSNIALYMDNGANVGSRVEAIVLTE